VQQSYGEEDLDVGSFKAGTVRVLGIHALPALYPRLGIQLGWVLREIPASEGQFRSGGLKDYKVMGCAGDLRVGRDTTVVGPLHPAEGQVDMRSSPYHSESHLMLACELNLRQIEQYEQLRTGGAAEFSLALWPVVVQSGEQVTARVRPFSFRIPQDMWIAFLSSIKYGEYDILEVRRPTADIGAFSEIRDQLHSARLRAERGDYSGCVSASRTALERAIQESKGSAPSLREVLVARTDASRGDAYNSIVSKAKELCNRAVHKPESSFSYSRHEALFIVRVVESSIALLGQLGPYDNNGS
jgi:hypothetical protein